MKKIEIVVLSNITINLNCKLLIFDSKNNLIYSSNEQNNSFIFNAEINKCYNLIFFNNHFYYKTSIIILDKYNMPYYIYINFLKKHFIKINLVDSNYKNLKIERGEIYLWENLIQ